MIHFSLLLAVLLASPAVADSLINLAQYPPTKINLTITTTSDAAPKIEPAEIQLLSGKYYRLTINCLTCATT